MTEIYMRKERLLYDYICEHVDENGQLITSDGELSTQLNLNPRRPYVWRTILKRLGLIEYKSKFFDRQKKIVITLIKK